MRSAPELQLVALLHRLAAAQVDFVVRADVIDLDGAEIRVVGLDDLLSMKRAAGRPQDLADIDALESARRIRRQG